MNYYAGIDGGGTVTKIVICDDNGLILHRGNYPSINCYGTEYNQAKNNFNLAIKDCYDKGYKHFKGVYIGSSSLIDKADDALKKDFTQFISADNIEFVGDINIILFTLTKRPAGVIISGTGSIMAVIDEKGKTEYAGGLGHLIGDEGSAYDIGNKGIRAAFNALEGWGQETILKDKFKPYFDTNDKNAIIEKIYCKTQDKSIIANFSLIVEECAALSDKVAIDILINAGTDLYTQFVSLIKKTNLKLKELILSGSVLSNSAIVRTEFIRLLNNFDSEIDCKLSNIAPEIRALHLARAIGENQNVR